MTPLKRFATRLAEARTARGWTQTHLAARAKLSRPYINRLEAARQDPALTMVIRLARVLGVKPSALVD